MVGDLGGVDCVPLITATVSLNQTLVPTEFLNRTMSQHNILMGNVLYRERTHQSVRMSADIIHFALIWRTLNFKGLSNSQASYVKWDLAGCLPPPPHHHHQCSSTVVYNWTAGTFAKLSSQGKGFTALAAEFIFLLLSYLERVAISTPKTWLIVQPWLGKLKTNDTLNLRRSGGILCVPHQELVSIQIWLKCHQRFLPSEASIPQLDQRQPNM